MIDLLKLLGGLLVGVFRSHAAREAEMAFLRQQLVVLQRSAPARLRLRSADRLIFVWLYRLLPSLLEAAVVFKPETLVRWHRSGFRLYWRCKSRRRVGRPAVPADIRDLIRTISHDNPLWGAPRIHGELLKLGIDIAQSTVAKYMSRRHGPRSPGALTRRSSGSRRHAAPIRNIHCPMPTSLPPVASKATAGGPPPNLPLARKLAGDDRYSSITRLRTVAPFGVPKIRALFEATYIVGCAKRE